MNARERAMAALARTPEEVEKARRRETEAQADERRRKEDVRQARLYHVKAVTKIKAALSIDTGEWRVLESRPDLVVLEDPEDGRIGGVKLSVSGGSYEDTDAMRVRYQPYSNWVGGEEGHSSKHDDWRGGPVVGSLLDLARAIRAKESHDAAVHASMPDHLP